MQPGIAILNLVVANPSIDFWTAGRHRFKLTSCSGYTVKKIALIY
jgi:hypothetical protein